MHSPHNFRRDGYCLACGHFSWPDSGIFVGTGHAQLRLMGNILFPSVPVVDLIYSLPTFVTTSRRMHNFFYKKKEMYHCVGAFPRRSCAFQNASQQVASLEVKRPSGWSSSSSRSSGSWTWSMGMILGGFHSANSLRSPCTLLRAYLEVIRYSLTTSLNKIR